MRSAVIVLRYPLSSRTRPSVFGLEAVGEASGVADRSQYSGCVVDEAPLMQDPDPLLLYVSFAP